jgi:hypothetical protein
MRDKSEMNDYDGECAEATQKKKKPISKCCKNTEQEHQLTYIKHEEGKRNILSRRKSGSMRNKDVKVKNFIQQKK